MPKTGRPMKMFRRHRHATTFVATLLVVSGVGGTSVLLSPTHRHAEVAVEHRSADAADMTPDAVADEKPAVVAAAPVVAVRPPVVVTKDSSAHDIVKAIVSHGRHAGLNDDQIITVIATAKIESSFRPAVSGGVQAYGGRGTAADEVIGLFQEKASFGTVAERQDPNSAITRFIARFLEAYRKHGITGDHVQAATLAQNPQLLKRNRGIGTQYYRTIQAAMGDAAGLHRQALDSLHPIA
ncbi:hypothetical protein A5727_20295 [Mycobacterium sp. ACS4331]|nr:hypothetical protein A5727_20295 [Mycobacterium sp. ACS4331]